MEYYFLSNGLYVMMTSMTDDITVKKTLFLLSLNTFIKIKILFSNSSKTNNSICRMIQK